MLEVRPATPEDYPRLCEIFNEIDPDHLETVESMLEEDRLHDARYLRGDFALLRDGRIIAQADFEQPPGMYHPRKFWLSLHTPASVWESGAQDALYAHLRAQLQPHDPLTLYTSTRENRPLELAWIAQNGFSETQRTWETHLTLSQFQPEQWRSATQRTQRSGYTIQALSAFEDTPEFRRKLYACWLECRRDVPRPGATTEPSFEQFQSREFESAYFLKDGYFIALSPTRELVALSALWRADEPGVLYTGLTGTARDHRSRGVALALKASSLEWAKNSGYAQVYTWNEQRNTVMLSINDRLGFERQPAWIDYTLELRQE